MAEERKIVLEKPWSNLDTRVEWTDGFMSITMLRSSVDKDRWNYYICTAQDAETNRSRQDLQKCCIMSGSDHSFIAARGEALSHLKRACQDTVNWLNCAELTYAK